VHAAPDLRRLEGFVKLSFEELREAARVGPPKTKKRRAKEMTAAKSAPVETVRVHIPLPASFSSLESKREPKPAPLTESEKVHPQLVVA